MFEQLDLLSMIENVPQENKINKQIKKDERKIYIGCKVTLNKNEVDDDDMLYFEYYKPESLESIGIVEDIQNGLFNVKFGKEKVLLKKNELLIVSEGI